MNKLWALPIVALVACRAEQAGQAVESRIAAIENRLMPRLVIRGEPLETSTLAERMEALGVPGVSIAVINDGEVEWARGQGLADGESGRPVTVTTLFQAASISEARTARGSTSAIRRSTRTWPREWPSVAASSACVDITAEARGGQYEAQAFLDQRGRNGRWGQCCSGCAGKSGS